MIILVLTTSRSRTVFGDPFTETTISEAFLNNKLDVLYDTHLKHHPVLKQYFGPVYQTVGCGWSISLKRTIGLTVRGISHYLSLIKQDITVIDNDGDFKTLVDKAKINCPVTAIVESGVFLEDSSDRELHVFAIVYEKKYYGHVLEIYDSCAGKFDKFFGYFGSNYQVYTPIKKRQSPSEATCHAYAIHDALLLKKKLASRSLVSSLDLLIPLSLFFGLAKGQMPLKLDDEFSFNALRYKQLLFERIILRELNDVTRKECMSNQSSI